MQRRANGSDASLDDCVLYKMEPGQSIMIPPGYAHVLVNPSDGPALMGGLYSFKALHDYRPVREMSGGAYYFLAGRGLKEAMPNPRYSFTPPLRTIESLAGTPFAPPDGTRPLWSSFVAKPQRYAFITQHELAESLFTSEDQSR
jgi:glucose-6-phosphate isomerase